jgi:hypothetical protein
VINIINSRTPWTFVRLETKSAENVGDYPLNQATFVNVRYSISKLRPRDVAERAES